MAKTLAKALLKSITVRPRILALLPDYASISWRRVKLARVQVYPSGEVRIVVPRAMSQRAALAFYHDKEAWISAKRKEFAELANNTIQLEPNELLLWGRVFTLSTALQTRISIDEAVVYTDQCLTDTSIQLRWYRSVAKEYLSKRIDELAQAHGFSYNKLYIREQRTRWGSCSFRKNISLNWKLVKAPVWVSDYVILHELLHTRILNHSKKFWLGMAELDPEFERAKSWLREHGPFL